ncbi:MAG: choice-of-anchor D domain-containing protein, partial [Gammaproteobacteria bacterium]|nr:choice-of-anchor D domain-containing protein [Gammaproteobacteria bacterium]
WSAPVAVDTTSPANGFTDLFSATFDGALTACTPSDPAWCSFFNGKPGPNRNIVITPTPTGAINGVPLGITPVPLAGSYLDLTLDPGRTQVTISGGTIAVPAISLTIQGGTPNSTVVNAGGAGVVFSTAPQTAALDANGRAEFLVNLAPAIAVDFSTFSVITAAPNGSCSGPLCAIIPILTLDMVRYRLVIDYDPTFTTFTADYIGQTGNNSILSITMNSVVPKITVTDNQAPANDQQVPFGDVTELTSATRTVTVTNSGGLDLAVGAVALAKPLAPPFALANDTCSAASLTPAASCTFDVTFSPTVVGNFGDTLDIPSNAQGTPTVTVEVSGSGVAQPVPAIAITDSVAPASDQEIPFGNITIGASADQTVTVANAGNADLVIGTVGGLAAPFELVNDGCSGQTLVPAASCTVDVRFAPTATGAAADSLEIPSNDGANPLAVVAVGGTGLSLATPDIEVTDNTLPDDDLLVPFGNVTEGTTRDRTITVRNAGGLDLLVGAIAGANPLAAPFTVEADACSNQTLAPGGSCIIALRYAPPATGNASDSLDIPSNDPDEATVTVQLTGAGITLGEGGAEPTSPGGGGGFMAIDPATLVLLGAAGLWGWRRRPAR